MAKRFCSMSYRVRSVSARNCDCLCSERREELLFGQRVIGFGIHLRLLVLGFDARHLRLLREQIVLQLHAKILERGFSRLQREAGVERFLLDLWVAQFENDRIRTHQGARPKQNSLDAAIGRRRQPTRVFRDERAEATHLANERPARDGIDQQRRAVDCWCGGFHPRQCHRYEHQNEQRGDRVRHLAQPLSSQNRRVAGNVHRCAVPEVRTSKPMPEQLKA